VESPALHERFCLTTTTTTTTAAAAASGFNIPELPVTVRPPPPKKLRSNFFIGLVTNIVALFVCFQGRAFFSVQFYTKVQF